MFWIWICLSRLECSSCVDIDCVPVENGRTSRMVDVFDIS